MPEMATVCQEANGTPPTMFSPRAPQGVGLPHNYYSPCGYPPPTGHGQYGPENYASFQPSPEQSSHLQHHVHHQQQQHHQQNWGYGMGVGMMGNGRGGPGGLPDEWTQGYLVPGNGAPVQNPYNYQYRGDNPHGPVDYASPMQGGHETDPQGMDGSPSPHTPSPGDPQAGSIGPNNQGAKSLRPPYEWMKPSASLPQAGKTRTKDKYRVVYSDHQRLELEKEFHFSKYITIRRKAEIAAQLGLSERQVKIWFQNRRAKERKQNKKREELSHLHNGISNSNGQPEHHHQQQQQQQQQQQLQPQPNHEHHPHGFFPKIEIEDEKVAMHDMPCHSTNLNSGAGLSSPPGPPTPLVLHPNLHSSPIMSAAPSIMSRSHSHPTMVRYDALPRTNMSPPTSTDEVTYRMSTAADSSGNSMNLSGSSDSGVVSSH